MLWQIDRRGSQLEFSQFLGPVCTSYTCTTIENLISVQHLCHNVLKPADIFYGFKLQTKFGHRMSETQHGVRYEMTLRSGVSTAN